MLKSVHFCEQLNPYFWQYDKKSRPQQALVVRRPLPNLHKDTASRVLSQGSHVIFPRISISALAFCCRIWGQTRSESPSMRERRPSVESMDYAPAWQCKLSLGSERVGECSKRG